MISGQQRRRSGISGGLFVTMRRTVVRYEAMHQRRYGRRQDTLANEDDNHGGLGIAPGSRARSRRAGSRLLPRFWQIMSRIVELAAVYALVVAGRMYAVTHWKLTSGDVIEYNTFAQAFWLGHPPLHQLPVEYPPLAIIPFSLTLLPPLKDIQTVFSL